MFCFDWIEDSQPATNPLHLHIIRANRRFVSTRDVQGWSSSIAAPPSSVLLVLPCNPGLLDLMTPRLLALSAALVVLNPSGHAVAQAANSTGQKAAIVMQGSAPSAQGPLAEADQLFAAGKFQEAGARYQAILKADPNVLQAQVGLIRSLMLMQRLNDAQAAADEALKRQPNSWLLQLTLGDLTFAEGRIPEAERAYLKAKDLAPNEAAAYLGLARVYRVYSLNRRAYDNLKRAHEVAPNELAVQLVWFNSLPHQIRISALESYLASPNVNPQIAAKLQQYLAFLKKNAAAPVHACKLVSNVKETNTKIYPIDRNGTKLGASGMDVKVNNQDLHLALDTGSSGVLLGRAAAEKLGLQRLAYQPIMGVGDSGQQGGYTAVADRIRVGDLEFQDCVVRVTETATPVTGQDGLIGSDVFRAYLIDIDIPGAKLRLSPLPRRPDETSVPTALTTTSQDGQELETDDEELPAGKGAAAQSNDLPRDAYVAPEMADWSKAYRFRSLLLTPTKVDGTGPLLFLIDTGSFSNVLSTRTAQQITQVRSDPNLSV
jgi:tetratricopeptide (TPR) repeat protein